MAPLVALSPVSPSALAQARPRRGRPTLSNEQLLDHALDLFLEQGFDRTSIEGICAAAGMAKRTIYARYGDKTSLFKAAMQRAIAEWIVPVDRLRAVECGDFEQTLLALGRLLLSNLISPAGQRLLRLTSAVSAHMPDVAAMSLRLGTDPTLAYLEDLFGRHFAPMGTAAPDIELAARAFLDLVVGGPSNATSWGIDASAAELERHMRFRIRTLLLGLEPREPRCEQALAENARMRDALAEAASAAEVLARKLAAG